MTWSKAELREIAEGDDVGHLLSLRRRENPDRGIIVIGKIASGIEMKVMVELLLGEALPPGWPSAGCGQTSVEPR
jgi:hypothetical protein